MIRILLVILILLPTISNADQGLKISCLNMKSMYGKKYEPVVVMKMNTRDPLVVINFEHFLELIKD